MRRFVVVPLVVPLVAALAACATLRGGRAAVAPRADLEARVDSIFARYDSTTPGCAVAVLRGDDLVLRRAYGMAHIGFGVPMTTATSMWIPYSEARLFTALAVAMLERDGRLSLDDPVRRHVPEMPAYASAVTVRHLLHHTSGLADYGVLAGPGWTLGDRLSEDEFFRILARWGRPVFAPGEGEMYSNTDYALLRILVERVTGGSLHDWLDARLFRPLGMTGTRVGADQATVVPDHALFHEPAGDGFRAVLRYRVSPVGGISVTTSVDDVARWARALRDPALGIEALLARLREGAPASAAAEGFAFGVYPRTDDGLRMVTYRGVGEYVWLTRVPEADLAVAALCNMYPGMRTYGPAVARLYAAGAAPGGPAAVASAPPPPPTPAAAVEVSPAELGRYVGEYRAAYDPPDGLRVDTADGGLRVTDTDGSTFVPRALGGGRFEFAASPTMSIRLTFTLTDSVAGGVLMASQIAATGVAVGPALHRWVPRQPTPDERAAYPGTYTGDDVDVTLFVSVRGDSVMLASRGLPATALIPIDADAFVLPDYTVRFHRDAAGRVTHLVLDARRVQGMRFTRTAGALDAQLERARRAANPSP